MVQIRHLPSSGRSSGLSPALLAIPLGLIMVIVATDLLIDPRIRLGPLLIVAPTITASFAGPRLVAVIGALAIAGHMVTTLHDLSTRFSEMAYIASLATVTAFIVVFAIARDRHRQELVQVRSVADAAQRALMRPLPHRLGPLRIASLYLTAEREAQVGGDLYAAARIRGGTRLIIGDVRGKGLAAIDTAALVVGAFWATAHQHAELPDLLEFLDSAAGSKIPRLQEEPNADESFVTVAVLDILDNDPALHVINRGHPPPLLINSRGVTTLDSQPTAPPLGLSDLCRASNSVETYTFSSGDTLLLYTDGVTETRDHAGRFYPLCERVAAWKGDDPETLLRHLHQDLTAHADGRLGDDAAVIAVKRAPTAD